MTDQAARLQQIKERAGNAGGVAPEVHSGGSLSGVTPNEPDDPTPYGNVLELGASSVELAVTEIVERLNADALKCQIASDNDDCMNAYGLGLAKIAALLREAAASITAAEQRADEATRAAISAGIAEQENWQRWQQELKTSSAAEDRARRLEQERDAESRAAHNAEQRQSKLQARVTACLEALKGPRVPRVHQGVKGYNVFVSGEALARVLDGGAEQPDKPKCQSPVMICSWPNCDCIGAESEIRRSAGEQL